MTHNPEVLWREILSQDPTRITAALLRLDLQERGEVLAHLRRMADEAGWSVGQARRARAALAVAASSLPEDEQASGG